MLELAASDPIIKAYLNDLQHLKSQHVEHELGLKAPFQNLLDKAAKRRGWTLVAELSTYSGGKRVVPARAKSWRGSTWSTNRSSRGRSNSSKTKTSPIRSA
jgi:hypothetical protein